MAILLAFFTWTPAFQHKHVTIHTDNLPLVFIWSRGSKDPAIMRLIRALFARAATHHTVHTLTHIPYIFSRAIPVLSEW